MPTIGPGWRRDLLIGVATLAFGSFLTAFSPVRLDATAVDYATGVAALGLIVARRVAPVPLLVVATASTVALALVYGRPTPVTLAALVLLVTVIVRVDRVTGLLVGIATGAALYTASLLQSDLPFDDERALLSVALTTAAVGIGDAIRSSRAERAASQERLLAAVVAGEEATRRHVVEERLAIARELHDVLAHSLSVVNVQTGVALHVLRSDPDAAEAALRTARGAGAGVLDELRDLLAVLRQDGEQVAPRDAAPTTLDVEPLVASMRGAGLDVTVSESGRPRPLAPAVALAARRIVGESLTNAARHGDGRASLVVAWSDERVRVEVTNRVATVTDPARDGGPAGHGVTGMAERARLHGGTFTAGEDGGVFRVVALLPVSVTSIGEERP